ncbi:MAG: helix-turn-helix domain-containing protein [Nitrospinae bacterium]|nr:helix-turn-helix domain-containing protein [Nitrospinota bacterium]
MRGQGRIVMEMAPRLKRDKSTISRELRRNGIGIRTVNQFFVFCQIGVIIATGGTKNESLQHRGVEEQNKRIA